MAHDRDLGIGWLIANFQNRWGYWSRRNRDRRQGGGFGLRQRCGRQAATVIGVKVAVLACGSDAVDRPSISGTTARATSAAGKGGDCGAVEKIKPKPCTKRKANRATTAVTDAPKPAKNGRSILIGDDETG